MEAEEDDRSGADASVSEMYGGGAEEIAVAGGEGCHGNGRRNDCDLEGNRVWTWRYLCGDGFLCSFLMGFYIYIYIIRLNMTCINI